MTAREDGLVTLFEIAQLIVRIALALRVVRPSILVAFTGLCELAGGVGLLIPATRVAAAICLAVFLIAVFPANAYAAGKTDRFGVFATPLVPRAILQVVLIALCVFCAL
jgi:uncharacterized membrane protein